VSSSVADVLRIVRRRLEAGESVPTRQVPEAVADCAFVDACLRRSLAAPIESNGKRNGDGDRLLTVEEAAQKLGCSKDRLYRHPPEFRSFERRIGRQLRFSEAQIERYIAGGGNGN
jgi:excisionase family DNA binding protein